MQLACNFYLCHVLIILESAFLLLLSECAFFIATNLTTCLNWCSIIFSTRYTQDYNNEQGFFHLNIAERKKHLQLSKCLSATLVTYRPRCPPAERFIFSQLREIRACNSYSVYFVGVLFPFQ